MDLFATETRNGEERTRPVAYTTHYENEGDVVRFAVRPRRDTVYSWSGAVYCGPGTQHGDLAFGMDPVSVRVVPGGRR